MQISANPVAMLKMPLGVKARVEMTADPTTASPALTGYMTLLEQNSEALSKMRSNIDESQLDDSEKAIDFLNSMKPDEFVPGAQVGEKTLLWHGTVDGLPAGVVYTRSPGEEHFGAPRRAPWPSG